MKQRAFVIMIFTLILCGGNAFADCDDACSDYTAYRYVMCVQRCEDKYTWHYKCERSYEVYKVITSNSEEELQQLKDNCMDNAETFGDQADDFAGCLMEPCEGKDNKEWYLCIVEHWKHCGGKYYNGTL